MKTTAALTFFASVTFWLLQACAPNAVGGAQAAPNPTSDTLKTEIQKIEKSNDVWKAELTAEEYYVLREKGTERSFSGEYWKNKEAGTYMCAGCQLPLFSSETKFVSGTGWPSFYDMIAPGHVERHIDNAFGMQRVEVVCARCDGHLGHVFKDGPDPTGLRYCINAVSLDFVAKEK